MPKSSTKVKMKTRRGARKRFRITRSGKVLRARAFKSHLNSHKSGKRLRKLRRPATVAAVDESRIRAMLGS